MANGTMLREGCRVVCKDRIRAKNLTEKDAQVYVSHKLNQIRESGFSPEAAIIRGMLFSESHSPGFWKRTAQRIADEAVVVKLSEITPIGNSRIGIFSEWLPQG